MSKTAPRGETITIGGRVFTLHKLKLGALRGLADALDDMAGKTAGDLIEAAARVVACGIPDPEVTTETILDIEATVAELNDAVAAVLRVTGFQPGEALPQPVQPLPTFTPPSPPAAAMAIAS